jgi:hypothetical protein
MCATRRITRAVAYLAVGIGFIGAAATAIGAAADDRHTQHTTRRSHAAGLLKIVREATERFHDVAVAEAEGYGLLFGCVSGPDAGAMGLHYVNPALTFDGQLDPARPEIIIYEKLPNGRLKMTGADFLVLADAWHANHTAPPEMMGQLFHLFEAPNRFGLPPFYTLHVWAWKENPNGTYVNWHPKVSCDAFDAQNP